MKSTTPNKISPDEIAESLTFKADRKAVNAFPIVAIGASAGGLEAVTQLLQNVSPTTGMAFIYVQHLSPDHKSLLPALLSKTTKMKVQDIDDMEKMIPNNVYVIPYNKGIEVTNGHIKLIPRVDRGSAISIDILFTSLAETHKENVIGIILSGSAYDGTRGLKEIKLAGGITFAQDDSAKFISMPKSAIDEGVVDFVLSPKKIAEELTWISKHPLIRRNSSETIPELEIDNSNADLKIILQLLHKRKNVDFSLYKMNTIKRRILRRMLIHKIKVLEDYATFLGQKNDEVDLLYQDLLINVTDFFRDIEAFEFLKNNILPKLLNKKTGETLRIWIAACATGEEVYSIAMLILELQEANATVVPFQIFASDLSAEAINSARIGEYSASQLKNITPEKLQRFFVKSKDKYRISKSLRDVCVFAQHNILRDPPFSRMDFISCRNVLIYLAPLAQKKAITTFHYALKEGGCLMLGKSETIGTLGQLFSTIDKKYKIYSRIKNSGLGKTSDLTIYNSNTTMPDKNTTPITSFKKPISALNSNIENAFDAVLLNQYVPASVIINHDLEILQFRGATSFYLRHSSGKASFNILKMAHLEITFELRNAIHQAIKTQKTVRKMGIEMNLDSVENTIQIVNIEVIPLTIELEDPLLIVIFSGQQQKEVELDPVKAGNKSTIAKDRRIKKLEEELASARADMGAITHDQEAANEELQSANEEIVSSNEELQSLNEELETSKEEIESTNEELTTSNQELQARIQEVEELCSYNEAILSTVHEPVIILDKDYRIKSVNKSFCRTFQVTEKESIGISLYKLGNNQWNIPRLRELIEDIFPNNVHFQDFEVEHVFPVIGKKTMILNAHRIIQKSKGEELIVLTISDITKVKKLALEVQLEAKKALETELNSEKRALKLVEDSNKRYNMMLMHSPFAFAILKGKNMVITLANDSMKEIWGKGNKIEGKTVLQVLPELKNSPIPKLLSEVFTSGIPFKGYEMCIPLKRKNKIEDLYFNFVYQPYLEADETISGITIIAYEVTSHVISKNELIEAKIIAEQKTQLALEAVKAKQQFLSNMSHEIRTPLNAIIGFTNIMLKTELDTTQMEYINAVKISGDSLIVLINDILDLAKVDAGRMTFEQIPFSLNDCINNIYYLHETKCLEKNLKLIKEYDSTIPEIILGDCMRLRQIILNLISNAVKFTAKGKITISVKLIKEDTEKITVEFKLTDTGIGIPKDQLNNIFDNFEQAANETSRVYGGTGLGLAIVKQLVELQGGKIILKSEVGKGSTFGFELDFKKTKSEITKATRVTTNKKTTPKNLNILVVEDMALNQILIKIILENFGFECDIAENGLIAIEKLQHGNYDIVLMDIQMPKMDGFEATKYIRTQLNSQIPIIALTADITKIDIEKSEVVGMNDYVPKPIDEKLLYDKIMKYVGKSKHKK